MSHELSRLKVVPASRTKRRRLGRGIGSGRGKTCGRGTKGQLSRSGGGVRPGFEGGQMPIMRRLPKRGFTNASAERWDIVNVGVLEQLVGAEVVDLEVMQVAGMVSGKRRVKILAKGELTKPFVVKAHAFSAAAQQKIEACGGKVEEL